MFLKLREYVRLHKIALKISNGKIRKNGNRYFYLSDTGFKPVAKKDLITIKQRYQYDWLKIDEA